MVQRSIFTFIEPNYLNLLVLNFSILSKENFTWNRSLGPFRGSAMGRLLSMFRFSCRLQIYSDSYFGIAIDYYDIHSCWHDRPLRYSACSLSACSVLSSNYYAHLNFIQEVFQVAYLIPYCFSSTSTRCILIIKYRSYYILRWLSIVVYNGLCLLAPSYKCVSWRIFKLLVISHISLNFGISTVEEYTAVQHIS